MAPDAQHWFGDDLALSPSGDLALSDGIDLSNERIVRRLMTNLASYIWHLDYGASVPRRVGDTLDLSLVESIIRSQIFDEASVSKAHDIIIRVQPVLNGVFCQIDYIEALTGQQASLNFDVVI